MNGDLGNEWKSKLPLFEDDGKKIATRAASGKVIEAISPAISNLIGGSADLTPSNNTRAKIYEDYSASNVPSCIIRCRVIFINFSNNTRAKIYEDYSASNYTGRYIRYGVRENAMGSLMNGMALYCGVITYGGTFLIFSDYMRPAIRLASLSGIRPIYIFTHDSIGLGEDGPTHQPIEHLAALRSIPKVVVIRPAEANETVYAWKVALQIKGGP